MSGIKRLNPRQADNVRPANSFVFAGRNRASVMALYPEKYCERSIPDAPLFLVCVGIHAEMSAAHECQRFACAIFLPMPQGMRFLASWQVDALENDRWGRVFYPL
ncbi:hypothetical protein N027_19325 [Pseudomonas syringae USA007]|uniref:Uncharacterized protein n=1 Tax=Pseudomonas syringae USA007 TaxID=1357288 RepID=A0AAU8M5P7_PSESX|nr:hypothetical protein [Pseudomonas syringae]